jgi:cytochrome P450
MGPTFTPEAVAGLMPGVQQTVTKHMARWAQQSSVEAYPAVRLLTFDVLVNQALGLGMDDAEIRSFSAVCILKSAYLEAYVECSRCL